MKWAALAALGYFGVRWWQDRQTQNTTAVPVDDHGAPIDFSSLGVSSGGGGGYVASGGPSSPSSAPSSSPGTITPRPAVVVGATMSPALLLASRRISGIGNI